MPDPASARSSSRRLSADPRSRGRHLHDWEEIGDGHGQGLRVAVGPLRGKQRPDLGAGAWLLLDQHLTCRQHRFQVDTGQTATKWALTVETAPQHALHDGAQRQAVACGDQMNRGPHQRHPHRLPACRRSASACWSNPSRRVQSATYGTFGTWACSPTRCSMVSAAGYPRGVKQELSLQAGHD